MSPYASLETALSFNSRASRGDAALACSGPTSGLPDGSRAFVTKGAVCPVASARPASRTVMPVRILCAFRKRSTLQF